MRLAVLAQPLDAPGLATLPETGRRTYRALKNAFAEIGEAVKLLPAEPLARRPDVDRRGWAGLRDIVSHRCLRLELAMLRPTIVEDLPVLPTAVTTGLARRQRDLGPGFPAIPRPVSVP